LQGLLAESLAACGLADEADRVLDAALRRSASRSFFYAAELLRLRGCLRASRGGPGPDAERFFEQAVEVARRQNAKCLELRALTSWVRLSNREVRPSNRLGELYRSFSEGFETADLRDAARALAPRRAANARR
jgi:hypothetical protein